MTPDTHEEEDELTRYLIANFGMLRSDLENRAIRAIEAENKAAHAGSGRLADMLRRKWGRWSDPALIAILEEGHEACRRTIRDRILWEHGDLVSLNRCPHCHRITRTPKAQQCFICGHDWHESTLKVFP